MKISEKKSQELYSAIHEPIMKMRVLLEMGRNPTDEELYDLNAAIWFEVKLALNIKD